MNHSPILICGFGSAGRRHFQNLQALGQSNFVFQRTLKSTLPGDEITGFQVVSTMDEALAFHPLMVFITNPTSLHVSAALQAARAGSHLFIEKPLSHELTGCEELSKLAQKSNLTTMIGCQHRFHPLLLSLRDGLRNGRIGKPHAAKAEYGEHLPDWHPWEDHRRSYSARRELGGGVILTLIHPIDYLYWLFGPVRTVQASASRVESLQTDVDDDMADITLHFASGVVGQVRLDYVQRPPCHTLTVTGEKGRAHMDFLAGQLCWELSDGTVQIVTPPTSFERNTMFIDEVKHFLDCVEQRKPTLIPLDDGIQVLGIALKAKDDARRRKP